VVELARALAMMPEVYRVDLFTRQICSPDVDWSYGVPTEMLFMGSYHDSEEVGESSGAYIVRIPFGPRYFALRTLENVSTIVSQYSCNCISCDLLQNAS
jgi:sucrose-phosphate synthase